MIQQEIPQSLWYDQYIDSPTFDYKVDESYDFTMDNHVVDDYEYDPFGYSEFSTTPSEVLSNTFLSTSTILTNDHHYPIDDETLQLPSLMELESLDSILSPQLVGIHGYQEEESEGSFPSQRRNGMEFRIVRESYQEEIVMVEDPLSPTFSVRSELSSTQQSLTLPQEGMEIDNQVILPHLMEACGEALEQGQKSQAEEILKCMSQKVTPLGESLETLAFFLSQEVTKHGESLKGEALKNYKDALMALYQGNPIGKIAHLAAIQAILEASVLEDCDEIHIIDSCMGHGFQWPFLLEAVAHMNKTLKLTSINDGSSECNSTLWNFEDTRRQLYEHAKSCGLINLKVEEKGLEELVSEMKRMNKRGGKRKLLAFNLMLGFPQMGMVRNRRQHALEFLKVAEDLIKSSGSKGIIVFGDGDASEKLKNSLNFRSFFEGHLVHYKALLEAIESQFTEEFLEARASCGMLFVAPYISSLDWLQTWEEMKRNRHLEGEIGIEGCSLSNSILMEVTEVLRGSEGSYQARIEGQNENELVLEWKGTQVLKFSVWKN